MNRDAYDEFDRWDREAEIDGLANLLHETARRLQDARLLAESVPADAHRQMTQLIASLEAQARNLEYDLNLLAGGET